MESEIYNKKPSILKESQGPDFWNSLPLIQTKWEEKEKENSILLTMTPLFEF